MNNTYPIGTPLTFVWRFETPEGSSIPFDSARHSFVLRYTSGRGLMSIDTFAINTDGDGITWTLAAEDQHFLGTYDLVLDILLDGSVMGHYYFRHAFSLYREGQNTINAEQEEEGATINLLSVGEFYHFTPDDARLSALEAELAAFNLEFHEDLEDFNEQFQSEKEAFSDDMDAKIAETKSDVYRIFEGITRGPRGEMGAAGLQGVKGEKGERGLTGATGPAGPQGPSGVSLGEVELSTNLAETTPGKALDASVAQYKIGFESTVPEVEDVDRHYYTMAETDAIIVDTKDEFDAAMDAHRLVVDAKLLEQDQDMAEFRDAIEDVVDNFRPIEITCDNITNAPDEEDLTSEAGMLKFRDRPALNGMGYKILRRNLSFASQVDNQNTIYEIRYDFDLRDAYEGLVLDSEFELGDVIYYTHLESISVVANQAVWVPSDCVVLNEAKDTLLSVNSSYMPSADENVFIACTESKTITYQLNGLVTIPAGCILKFNGGKLEYGNISLSGVAVLPNYNFLSNDNITLSGHPKAGTMMFDGMKPLWSNGTAWVDATGTEV